jgi:hypothetical protein
VKKRKENISLKNGAFIKMKISVNTKSEIIRVNHPFDVILIDSRMISIPFYFNVYEQVNPYNLAR